MSLKQKFNYSAGWASVAAMGLAFVAPSAYAQTEGDSASGGDIVVTARRVEEKLLDVPISITVFNQESLDKNNVSSAKDLAVYTPGLTVNSRYGSDNVNFSIRGFTQEQRTYATVGTYFADVVAPRGSGATFGGDGAGPGSLFDLQNVQVLKGPQGTLFGRNVPGGAVLLVPNKPTDRFEGYVQGSLGDYNLKRAQGVVNIPIAENFKVRLGLDHSTRDGYLKNIGNLGDGANPGKDMGNVDYTALRFSALANFTPNIENLTVLSWSQSDNNGVIPKTIKSFPGVRASGLAFGDLATAQIAREGGDPWTVSNRLSGSQSYLDTWQAINTTTWDVNDELTIKNIVSYGEFKGRTNLDLFGNYFLNPAVPFGTETSGNQVGGFAFTYANPNSNLTNAQSTFTEEFQLQGHPADGRLTWQAGAYAEVSNPLGISGVQTSTFTACQNAAARDCAAIPGVSFGLAPTYQDSSSEFTNYALYGQASYNFTEQLKLTLGARYTWDEQKSTIHISPVSLATGAVTCLNSTAPDFGPGPASRSYPANQLGIACGQNLSQATEAPTYLIGLDYKPTDTTLVYAKYSKAYRAGGLALFSPDTTQSFQDEEIDNYEIGAKASWGGVIPGNISVAAFWNDFVNQQLLLGVSCDPTRAPFQACSPSAAIVNAGASTLNGFEADLSLRPIDGLRIDVGYAFLDTTLDQFTVPSFPANSPFNVVTPPLVGQPIPNSIPNKVNLSVNYVLPLSEEIGKVSLGGTYVWTDEYKAVAPADPVNFPGNGTIPDQQVLNLNASWESILGRPVDLGIFATNVTDEANLVTVNDNTARGFVSGIYAEPSMWGVNVKYHFGN